MGGGSLTVILSYPPVELGERGSVTVIPFGNLGWGNGRVPLRLLGGLSASLPPGLSVGLGFFWGGGRRWSQVMFPSLPSSGEADSARLHLLRRPGLVLFSLTSLGIGGDSGHAFL